MDNIKDASVILHAKSFYHEAVEWNLLPSTTINGVLCLLAEQRGLKKCI